MSTTAAWVVEAIEALSLERRVLHLDDPERSDVLRRVTATFVQRPDVLFWWEHLKVPSESWQTANGYRHLPHIAPDPEGDCWLVTGLEDADSDKGVFQCTPMLASKIVAECPGFEYALVDRGLKWLVIENHHDVLIAAGETGPRLSRLRE
jgi:hypothetical protein